MPSKSELTEELIEATDQILDDIDRLLDQDAIGRLREELEKFDPLEAKIPTLSDLMREGATLNPQAIGQWVGQSGETCALSAATTAARARGLL